jgi:hypothetical protein
MSPWLAAAYAVLALGLAWTLAGGGGWKRRVPFVVCAPALAFALWLDRPDPRGWPSPAALPAHASLVAARVDEPDPEASDPGRIFLWLDVGRAAPRAYAVPYSRSLHRQVQRALSHLQHRQSVEVSATSRRGRAGRGRGRRRLVVRLYPHPPVQLPAKAR